MSKPVPTRGSAFGRAVKCSLLLLALVACSAPPAADAPNSADAGTSAAPVTEEGMLDVPGGRVWYRRIGAATGVPLLALHGGPGGTSCRFEVLAPLANERPLIYYDQLGSGRSDHPSDTTLWNVARFVQEVDAVRRGLGLDTVHLLGHSWGGALAAEYMLAARPTGVRSVVLSSPLLSTPRWIDDANQLRAELPAELRATLDRHETDGTTDAQEYAAATDSFYARHVRRLPVSPEPMCDGVSGNDAIYRQMWGPTEFRSTGSLRTWDRSGDLDELTLPVLFIAGEFDEARPATLESFRATMPDARLEVIPGSSHSTYREQPARYIEIVRAFLRAVDSAPFPVAPIRSP